MALLILPATSTLEEKIHALSHYGDILDNLADSSNNNHPMTQIIVSTLLSSVGTITRNIPDDQITRVVYQAFHKFYNSLTRVMIKFSSNPASTSSQFQPLLDEISKRIGTAPR